MMVLHTGIDWLMFPTIFITCGRFKTGMWKYRNRLSFALREYRKFWERENMKTYLKVSIFPVKAPPQVMQVNGWGCFHPLASSTDIEKIPEGRPFTFRETVRIILDADEFGKTELGRGWRLFPGLWLLIFIRYRRLYWAGQDMEHYVCPSRFMMRVIKRAWSVK